MKNKKLCLALLASICMCTGCNESSSKTKPNTEEKTLTDFIDVTKIDIEVDETFDLNPYFLNPDAPFSFQIINEKTASLNDKVITGVKKGSTELYIYYGDSYQKIPVNVFDKKALKMSFDFSKGRLYNKKVLIFGDSVSYGAGLKAGESKWWEILQSNLGFNATNYAVSGTTMTYMYAGSNIEKEYRSSGRMFNGVGFILSNINQVKTADYIFIFYGHNDLYFQPPIGDSNEAPKTLDECTSFKASYAYGIKTIQENNPKARIILITPNYSIYTPNPNYNIHLGYADYNEAILDLAEYYRLKTYYIWELTKEAHEKQSILADNVHMNARGHQILADYILNS